jgi:hypothetical protein
MLMLRSELPGEYTGIPNLLTFNTRITFIGDGFVRIERALPYNVSTSWNPKLWLFDGACDFAWCGASNAYGPHHSPQRLRVLCC